MAVTAIGVIGVTVPISLATRTGPASPHNPVLVLADPGLRRAETSAGEGQPPPNLWQELQLPELVWSRQIDVTGGCVTAAPPACALLPCCAFLLTRNGRCRCIPFRMLPRPSLPRQAAMQLENTSYFINLQLPPRQTIISSSPNDSSWVAFCTAAALYSGSPAWCPGLLLLQTQPRALGGPSFAWKHLEIPLGPSPHQPNRSPASARWLRLIFKDA